jgi:hypothetical protein
VKRRNELAEKCIVLQPRPWGRESEKEGLTSAFIEHWAEGSSFDYSRVS